LRQLLHWLAPLRHALLALGPFGLFVLSVIDASSIPTLPEIVMIRLALQHPHSLLGYVLIATAGSTLGTLIVFGIARHFGGPWIEKKMSHARFQRIHNTVEQYDVFAVAIPAMLPPPTPFKLFVIAAGFFEIPWLDFTVSMFIGRGVRYFVVAYLAVHYGAEALNYVRHHLWVVAALAIALIALGYWMGERRRHAAAGVG
jgi:membrane protein YqaA with SNARE-associated domain